MENFELKYKHAGTGPIDFEPYDFILEDNEEVFLIGFDYFHMEINLLGIVCDLSNNLYVYEVKKGKSDLESIIDSDFNTKHKIYSDISSGVWKSKKLTKKEGIPAKLKYFLSDGIITCVQKGPCTHFDSSFMVPTGDGLFKKIELKKAI